VTFAFNPAHGLIYVEADILGPTGHAVVRMALDTGATGTLIDMNPLRMAGYDPAAVGQPVQARTVSGVITTCRFPVLLLIALGQTRTDFQVAAGNLSSSSSVDGVLGLDFLRGNVLTIDFVKGEITLAPAAGATP
jgi:hypothetical protein